MLIDPQACLRALAWALATPLAAQITVNPSGSGQFTDLQAAIDAAPAGGVVHVQGGTYGNVTVRRSVTILGAPRFSIFVPHTALQTTTPGSSRGANGIDLDGSGSDTLTLSGCSISGIVGGLTNFAGHGIGGDGFTTVRLVDCVVRAPDFGTINGTAFGEPAIALDSTAVHLTRCFVQGSPSLLYDSQVAPVDGPPGIVTQAAVTAVDSVVLGGAGSDFFSQVVGWWPLCPCPNLRGHGGPGIQASPVYQVGGTIQGGRGGTHYELGQIMGSQPDGPPVVGTLIQVPVDMRTITPPRLGQTWTFAVNRSYATLLVGLAAANPTTVPGFGVLFLDPSVRPVPVVVSGLLASIPVPNNPALAGLPVASQFVERRLSLQLSSPVLEVVSF